MVWPVRNSVLYIFLSGLTTLTIKMLQCTAKPSSETCRWAAANASAADRLGLSPSAPQCHPKMAESVLQRAAAAGSNYWLDCGKWGQMQCIIREPVDSGSLSQWLVINKIIGERWQRFLEFFLICMSFCAGFFMTLFLSVKVDSPMTLPPTVSFACAVDLNWQ